MRHTYWIRVLLTGFWVAAEYTFNFALLGSYFASWYLGTQLQTLEVALALYSHHEWKSLRSVHHERKQTTCCVELTLPLEEPYHYWVIPTVNIRLSLSTPQRSVHGNTIAKPRAFLNKYTTANSKLLHLICVSPRMTAIASRVTLNSSNTDKMAFLAAGQKSFWNPSFDTIKPEAIQISGADVAFSPTNKRAANGILSFSSSGPSCSLSRRQWIVVLKNGIRKFICAFFNCR